MEYVEADYYDYYHGVTRVLGVPLVEDGRLTVFALIALLLAVGATIGALYYTAVARPKMLALRMLDQQVSEIAVQLGFLPSVVYGRTVQHGEHKGRRFAFWVAMEQHGFSAVPIIRVLAKTAQGTRNTFRLVFGAPAAKQIFGVAADQPDSVVTVREITAKAISKAMDGFPVDA